MQQLLMWTNDEYSNGQVDGDKGIDVSNSDFKISAPSSPNHCRPRAGRVGGVGGGDGSTRLSVAGPNLLPVAPTIASHGPAGLGVLGVETVATLRRVEAAEKKCPFSM